MNGPLDSRTLERIRRCYDDYSETNQAAYRAFWCDAHKNMGLLLGEVDRLLKRDGATKAQP